MTQKQLQEMEEEILDEDETELEEGSEGEELEEGSEEELDESDASDTLRPNSRPAADPKSKVEVLRAVVGAIASAEDHDLEKWHNQAMALIGHEADKTPDAESKNKESISAKPSDAVGSKDGSGTFKMPLVSVKEDLTKVFNTDSTLTEDAKVRMEALFEAAVTTRVMLEKAQLEEELAVALDEAIEEIVEELKGQLDNYLTYCVDQWMVENEVAIESTLKNELTEEFMDDLQELFAKHYINIPADKVDLVEELVAKNNELEEALNDVISENNELRGHGIESQLDELFDEVCEGLTMSQAEKLQTLAEGIEYDGDLDVLKRKLEAIKDTYVTAPVVNEEIDADAGVITEEAIVDPLIQKYAQSLKTDKK